MRYGIIGTAGHVDHGKTCLIQALTGIDTDRLKEEKKRGITIELGFAWMDFPDGGRVGIVDVPGHEKFVKNMLAGAGGMDLVMLVVAADEGVMPQTVEHPPRRDRYHQNRSGGAGACGSCGRRYQGACKGYISGKCSRGSRIRIQKPGAGYSEGDTV